MLSKVNNDNRQAFTLIEMTTVIIIIGILAAFAIPQYQASLQRAYEKSAVMNLRSIVAAEHIYKVENGSHWVAIATVNDINNTLRLKIIPDHVTYSCDISGAPNDFRCIAQSTGSVAWQAAVSSAVNDGAPWCLSEEASGTFCPLCRTTGCPY